MRMSFRARAVVLFPLAMSISLAAPPKPPTAKRVPHEMKLFGDARQDPYFWMRDRSNPDVMAYVKAENAYTDAVFAPFEPLVAKVNKEILSHIKQTDLSPPYPDGGYLY